jgi:eukaryotic translation initiation factor 2C
MAQKSFPEVRSFSSAAKMKSGASQQAEPSGSSGHPNFASEMPFREFTSAKPLGPRLAKDLREHKSNVHEDASRKRAEEANAWKRRMRIDPDTGKRQVKETGSSSENSPIRRNESPKRWPQTWTKEEKANAELLEREAVEVAVYEPERIDQDKTIQHQGYVEVHWDGCKNIDIPWHQFKILPSSVSNSPKLSMIYSYSF